MSRFTRMQTLNTMYTVSVVPVFYHADVEVAKRVMTAVAEGGCPLLEFTNRGDFAWEVFAALEKFCAKELPQMVLGVGSICDPETAGLYINNGANFVVGPVLNPDVAKICNRRKIPYSPGCGSASEVSYAEELGCEICKVFPGGQVGGPEFVQNIRGPMPWTSIMPTGGVEPDEESLRAWFKAGVAAVGMGSKLITTSLVKKEDWKGLTLYIKEIMDRVATIKAECGR